MLYGEFIEGTGCRDNEHNYKVYKDLEIMYMNSDMSKAEIYEYGKKLVCNDKSPEALAFEAEIKDKIQRLKDENKSRKEDIEWYEEVLERANEPVTISNIKHTIKWLKKCIKDNKKEIAELKWVLLV